MSVIRRVSWSAGMPIRALLVGSIRVYRATLSGWFGGQCRFYPTCSHYAEDALHSRGAIAGTAFIGWRVLRCNPFGRGGMDPAPSPRVRLTKDAVIPEGLSRAGS